VEKTDIVNSIDQTALITGLYFYTVNEISAPPHLLLTVEKSTVFIILRDKLP